MNKLIKELEKNEMINKLLKCFEDDFIKNYEKSDDLEEYLLENNRDTIFRKWLFSPILETIYITPNYIINNIAQEIEEGNYTIIPHAVIHIENFQVNFKFNWIIYSEEKNPVLDDLNVLLSYCKPVLTKRFNNIYVLDNGEEIIDAINFRSGYYINYLIDIAVSMNLLKKMESINCFVYQIGDNYEKYSKLSDSEKIKMIIESSFRTSTKNIEKIYDVKDDNIILKLLDNNIILDDFMNLLTEIKKIDSNMMYEEEYAFLGRVIDINFTSVFGYYLGLVMPVYNDSFFTQVFLKIAKKAIKSDMLEDVIFQFEAGHELTASGDKILMNFKDKFRDKTFKKGTDKLLNDVLEHYLSYKDEYEAEIMGTLYEIDEDFDIFNEVPHTIGENLNEFFNYLAFDKHLKKETCEKHYENVMFYIHFYLQCETLKDFNRISQDSLHEFLLKYFIPKFATSKTNVKDEMISLNQYFKFLSDRELINKDIMKDIKGVMKNKEFYVTYFEEWINDEDDF
ncbi:hypothetical protein SAMN04487886_11632 [Clostridium sp. DSM 8431]|uniref:hypothetical protein n=1 Tax=Clostridium sp. DSM 8431 TaxID=1761781 RepID=UPI0008E68DAE|nr:hypothetical protein [Clostridium sp. DSM 8431]SFU78939.1 hypothetical protein SAMN04487886_11632 [Clostridium sp. DSM 8431]